MKNSPIPAPRHLSAEARKRWRALVDEYDISDAAGAAILTAGLESFDRAREAQARIDAEGVTVKDRWAQTKAHPLIACERDARAAYLQAIKMLNLDLTPASRKIGRPEKHPRLTFKPGA